MASPNRLRRSRHEVDQLILHSARTLFAAKGFAGTTTKEIAAHAGVHEPMVYRRFESKARLYEAAVLVPFGDVVSRYLEAQLAQVEHPSSVEQLVRAFVEPLYDLLSEHRDLALALAAGQGLAPGAGTGDDGDPPLVRLLRQMEPQLEMEAQRRALRVDSPATLLVTVGMVLGLALVERPALEHSPGWVTRRQLVEEAVNMILYGVVPRGTHDKELLDRLIDAERRAAQAELQLAQLRKPPRTP